MHGAKMVVSTGCRVMLGLCACLLTWIASPVVAADNALARLTNEFCVTCHGGEDAKADLRLDQHVDGVGLNSDRLETLLGVLINKQMPPAKSVQPSKEQRDSAIEYLKSKLLEREPPARLKRLTRAEYTNTINDLFHAHFRLDALLPADPSGEGFDKWGETQRMSPFQVEAYLRTARFVADRLIPDKQPEQRSWEFQIKHFRGTERGDFQTASEHVLTTHYPWRSILYFVETEGGRDRIFRVPEFGRYWIQADATVHFSDQSETVSLSTGDPRYPTNVQKVARAVMPADGSTMFWEVSLHAGEYISFTYDSAATWNPGQNRQQYRGRQVRFKKVRITGPISKHGPAIAEQKIFDSDRFRSLTPDTVRAFTEHVVALLLKRTIAKDDLEPLADLVGKRLDASGNSKAAARTLLTALLSSPHFVYKHETESLSDLQFAHRLAYFLWNSLPDGELLEAMSSSKPRSRDVLAEQVERMLDDVRSDRFCDDFTRQWLATDKIDDIGPDDRVHNKKKVTFIKVRELAREPYAFFRELVRHDLSMLNFIDSEFAMVNDETSTFYGYDQVSGRAFQRVAIPEHSERGGLIGQAGLLKLTSSKHATSPIRRGSWVIRRIYGEKLHPPPGLDVEEPDIRAAETVKEVIELHKNSESCNRCHARIDPLGLALEHYDEMGLWRDTYRHVESRVGDKTLKRRTAPIDTRATLLDGRQVSSMTELKAVLMEDREQVMKALVSKLASYALGRELGLRDDGMIDDIYRRIGKKNYSLRAAIHEIVAHEAFGKR